uniref:Uncharacterized protein n=1 Tax=Ananas comosus var. bracteatus TaxID=296719 RepID=A0A6V7NWL0_ANACO|nr:unnamed protein product [Ananas comosus var. bracteatus]
MRLRPTGARRKAKMLLIRKQLEANSDPSFGSSEVGPKVCFGSIDCADTWLVVGEVRRNRIWAQHTAGGGTEVEYLCSLEISDAQNMVSGPESARFYRDSRFELDSGDSSLPWNCAREPSSSAAAAADSDSGKGVAS